MVTSKNKGANTMITKTIGITDLVQKYPAAAMVLMQSGMG